MSRIVIISNRLPYTVSRSESGFTFKESVGGLATGLNSLNKDYDKLWIGWPGISVTDPNEQKVLTDMLSPHKLVPVFLDDTDFQNYYSGFSNKTLWPLFHYFTQYTNYTDDYWHSYEVVNNKFAEVVNHCVNEATDLVWVQDYQLMLLPLMIRSSMSNVAIGFFLHIPFPSYEMFRTLPWRKQLLHGVLGADCIGFHTLGYFKHFMVAVQNICGLECSTRKRILVGNREVSADVYPMGIDYDKYSVGSLQEADEEWNFEKFKRDGVKLILSVDRLDYTKGIPHRIKAFKKFLEKYEQYRRKVTLVMIVVPCRSGVEEYMELKEEIEKLTGNVNSDFANALEFDWSPIVYLSRSFISDKLCPMLREADICLVTPLRDGMNLVAKEFVAAKHGCDSGVLILSEMAGAADELVDGIIVNPNNLNDIVEALRLALEMPIEEQKERLERLQAVVKNFTVQSWAASFIADLKKAAARNRNCITELDEETSKARSELHAKYRNAKNCLLLLDYDGTLMSFDNDPLAVKPDHELMAILTLLCAQVTCKVVVISGRDRKTLQTWLGDAIPNLDFAAEHGLWLKQDSNWRAMVPVAKLCERNKLTSESLQSDDNDRMEESDTGLDSTTLMPTAAGADGADSGATESKRNSRIAGWMAHVYDMFEQMREKVPGSKLERKPNSIAWHYRTAEDPVLADQTVKQYLHSLQYISEQMDLNLLQGNKVLEVRMAGVDKGRAALQWIIAGNNGKPFDFILAIGDDATDEDTFKALKSAEEQQQQQPKTGQKFVPPTTLYSVKIGDGATEAKYSLSSVLQARNLLRSLLTNPHATPDT